MPFAAVWHILFKLFLEVIPWPLGNQKKTKRKRRNQVTHPQDEKLHSLLQSLPIAGQASDPRNALVLYQEALDTAKEFFSSRGLEGTAVNPGDDSRTQVYLEALFGVARSLQRLDQCEEAARRFSELLDRDAGDSQFARYWLARCLLDLKRHDELIDLLEQFDDDSAMWLYTEALVAFRLEGDSEAARACLQDAYRSLPGFTDYLLGEEVVYAQRPIRFDGPIDEVTHSYAHLFLPAWRATPGAASWARQVLKIPVHHRPTEREMDFPKKRLSRLPQCAVTWQLGLKQLDSETPDEPAIWVVAVANIDDRKMLVMSVVEEEPVPEVVWEHVLNALQHPMEGEAHRPGKLVVPREDFLPAWKSMLDEVGIRCLFAENPEPIGGLVAGMAEVVKSQRLPQLSEETDPGEFPQCDAVWQADFFHSPMWITNDEEGTYRPWTAVILDRDSGFVLGTELLPDDPTPERLHDYLIRIMAHPGGGPPVRPAQIEVSDSDCYDFLKPRLAEWNIDCRLVDELPELREFTSHLVESYGETGPCALAEGDGVTMEQMEEFYYAAKSYFEQVPWKHVPGEIPIQVACRDLNLPSRHYAIVLGRTGVTLGLALYDDYDALLDLLRGYLAGETIPSTSVIFDEIQGMATRDLMLVEQNGWPIATREAYPFAMRVLVEDEPRSPSADELTLLIACLKVFPDFVTQAARAKTYEIENTDRRLKIRLSWCW